MNHPNEFTENIYSDTDGENNEVDLLRDWKREELWKDLRLSIDGDENVHIHEGIGSVPVVPTSTRF